MSHRLHLFLMIGCEVLGFVGAALWVLLHYQRDADLVNVWVIGPALAMIGVPPLVFRFLIAARCAAPGCPGRARPRGSSPIRYHCATCGHVERTKVSIGRSARV